MDKVVFLSGLLATLVSLTACSPDTPSTTQAPTLHPSWDKDGDGRNDCEKDGSCDHTVDYTKARSSAADARSTSTANLVAIRLACDDDSIVTIAYAGKDAEAATLTRGDKAIVLQRVMSASGAKYEADGTVFWEHQGEAHIHWGDTGDEFLCRPEE